MNSIELKKILDERRVNPSAYSLVGGLPNEAYVLSKECGAWSVYYSERGIRTEEIRYPTETEACEALLKKIGKI